MTALRGLLRKEFFHIRRDKRTAAVLVMLPVVQVLLFGYAIRTDVNDVRLAVVDPSPDSATIDLRNRFAAAGIFRIVATAPRTDDLNRLFQTGAAEQAIVFRPGFAEDLRRTEPAQLLVITDATEPNTGALLQAYAQAVVQQYQADLTRSAPQSSSGAGLVRPAITIAPIVRTRFNPTRASSNLFVPGLMAFVLTIISSLMTAITLTREKETGTMEALLVSPLRPWEIIAGKVVPYLAIGFAAVVLVLVEALIVFRVPLRGSVLLLLFEGALYILVSLNFGILISSRTSSQRLAMLGVFLTTLLPNILLSGFIFPLESMPAVLRWISFVVPGRWFVTIARGIMLKGIGLEYLWRETLYMTALAFGLLVVSLRSFNERLE
jgi:ABC-2 type transport system permease protein